MKAKKTGLDFDAVEKQILCEVAGLSGVPEGAYNFRLNGESVGRRSTANIEVSGKQDGTGLDIRIKPGTKSEVVHIPVIISDTGLKEVVYNDFYVGEGAEVLIVAGCGIYNCGGVDAVHNGVHRFFVEKGAKVKYVEKHYGFGPGQGGKILNPTTELFLADRSEAWLEMEQIRGVDSTIRETKAVLQDGAKIVVKERLLTHGRQTAKSSYLIKLKGQDATAEVVARSVAQDYSRQKFSSRIEGNGRCRGHSACDALIMDSAQVLATPALNAKSVEAELVHEAAIGRIAGEQLTKLMTLGLDAKAAESQIINGFLK